MSYLNNFQVVCIFRDLYMQEYLFVHVSFYFLFKLKEVKGHISELMVAEWVHQSTTQSCCVVRVTNETLRRRLVSHTYDLISLTYELISRTFDLESRTYDLVSRTYDFVSRTYDFVSRTYNAGIRFRTCYIHL